MQPTLRQLEYIVAIADEGSFHAAARACHVSQPGLSAQVQQLESQLGVRVFERSRRRVLPTAAGEEILRRAREVLAGMEQLLEAARASGRPLAGRLRLGVIPTIAPYLLPRILPRTRKRYPELRLELLELQTSALLEQLQQGRLDLLLLALESPLGDVETAPLFRDPFVAALSRSHPLARRKRLAEADLAGERVLLLEDGHCLRDQALAVCEQAGAEETTDFRASSLPTLVQMVAGGAGVTLLPGLALPVEGRTRDLVLVPFRKPEPFRTIGLAWRPSSPRTGDFHALAEIFRASA